MTTQTEAPSYESLDIEAAEAAAEERGCEIIAGTRSTLQVDIDNHKVLPPSFHDMYGRMLQEGVIDFDYSFWLSKSGNGLHVVLSLIQEADVTERMGFQLLLGSDPIREWLAYRRWLLGVAEPFRLFRPKDANVEVFSAVSVDPVIVEDLPW